MLFTVATLVLLNTAKTLSYLCSEPTTIQIQNYDGPIYLHIPATQGCEDTSYNLCPTYQQAEIECTCIAKPSIKYIPINTASESSCSSGRNHGTYNPNYNAGTCTCGTCNSNCNPGTCTCSCNTNYNSGTCTCGTYNSGTIGRGCKGDKVYCTLDIVKPQSACESGYNNNCICHKCNYY